MNESDPLLLQFAISRPAEFAALMGDTKVGELGELMSRLPAGIAAEIAARLPSRLLCELLASQPPVKTGEMLVAAKHGDAVALVSHLQESHYPGIVAVVPQKQRSKINRMFNFPSLSLSALASPDFIRVTENSLCESCCTELAAYEGTSPCPIFVVDEQGVYLGILNVLAVFATRNRNKKVGAITANVDALSGEMSAATALQSPLWLHHPALPVVDGKRRILGSITRSQLQRMVPTAATERFGLEVILAEVAQGYLNVCADVMESLFVSRPK